MPTRMHAVAAGAVILAAACSTEVPVAVPALTICPSAKPPVTCPPLTVLPEHPTLLQLEDAWIDAQPAHLECTEALHAWSAAYDACAGGE